MELYHSYSNERGTFYKLYDFRAVRKLIETRDTPRNPYVSGYGRKIPTNYMLQTEDGRYRRVYCMCYGNSGTVYVLIDKKVVFCESAIDFMKSLCKRSP